MEFELVERADEKKKKRRDERDWNFCDLADKMI